MPCWRCYVTGKSTKYLRKVQDKFPGIVETSLVDNLAFRRRSGGGRRERGKTKVLVSDMSKRVTGETVEKNTEEADTKPQSSKAGEVHLFKELPPVLRVLVFSACTLFILAIITACIQYTFFLSCYDRWWSPFDYEPRYKYVTPARYAYVMISRLSLFGLAIFILDFFAGLEWISRGKLRWSVYASWILVQLGLFVIAILAALGWPGWPA